MVSKIFMIAQISTIFLAQKIFCVEKLRHQIFKALKNYGNQIFKVKKLDIQFLGA